MVNIQPNGKIVWPVVGTKKWEGSRAVGVWGRDLTPVPMLATKGGAVRELNALELTLYAEQINEGRP